MKLTKQIMGKLSRKAPGLHKANERLEPSEVKQKAEKSSSHGRYVGQK